MKVKIELVVDIRELEFHGLEIGKYNESSEAWGRVENRTVRYAEWDSVTWNGETVCLIDDADAENYLVDEAYYGYDEGHSHGCTGCNNDGGAYKESSMYNARLKLGVGDGLHERTSGGDSPSNEIKMTDEEWIELMAWLLITVLLIVLMKAMLEM